MNSATVLCGMTGFCLGGPSWGQILSPWLGLKDFQNLKEQAETLSLIFLFTKKKKCKSYQRMERP
jgi:hypothetical protein